MLVSACAYSVDSLRVISWNNIIDVTIASLQVHRMVFANLFRICTRSCEPVSTKDHILVK